jgi:EpsI family protein
MRGTPLLRFLLISFLLASTAIFLEARRKMEAVPPGIPIHQFPMQVADWTGRNEAIDPDTLRLLGPGDFLSRLYQSPSRPWVDFFLAFFPSQETGDTIHSPKNCIPAAGWTPIKASVIDLPTPAGSTVPANLYIVQKGSERELVIYWYQAHGRVTASEYWARFYLVADAIRMNRTDGSLVRIVTSVLRSEDEAAARRRAVEFAERVMPTLDRIIPQ